MTAGGDGGSGAADGTSGPGAREPRTADDARDAGGADGEPDRPSRPPPEAQERGDPAEDSGATPAHGGRRFPAAARERAPGGRPRRRGRRARGEADEPRLVGGLVRAVFEKLGIADRVERAAAAGRWEEVVGPEIARRTGDVRVSGRTLFVEVESASWMQELDMRRHQILRKINEGVEEGTIEKIVFVQEDDRSGPRRSGG